MIVRSDPISNRTNSIDYVCTSLDGDRVGVGDDELDEPRGVLEDGGGGVVVDADKVLPVDAEDHVAAVEAGLVGAGAGLDVGDEHAAPGLGVPAREEVIYIKTT